MNTAKILELMSYTLPALITGSVAYYFFVLHTKNEQGRRSFQLAREAQKDVLPLRLQAYERMTLFLERISLSKLIIRISPLSDDKSDYANYLIAQIEQEFEHNLAQQIYMSDECWTVILTAKNSTIQIIRRAAANDKVANADAMREQILTELMEKQSPGSTALLYVKNEVGNLW